MAYSLIAGIHLDFQAAIAEVQTPFFKNEVDFLLQLKKMKNLLYISYGNVHYHLKVA